MTADADVLVVARVVHEALRAYQIALGEQAAEPWDSAEEWQRQMTAEGVRHWLANPGASATDLHDLWAEELRALGWTYGPVKDAEAKTHPSLVEFSTLSPGEQIKDRLFVAIVRAFAEGYGVAAGRKPM